MTVVEAESFLGSVQFRNPALAGLRFAWKWEDYALRLTCQYRTADRETGYPTTINAENRIPVQRVLGFPGDLLKEQVIRWLRSVFEHEFWEAFHVDGKRYRDPHADE
jgi:hypothetical protein